MVAIAIVVFVMNTGLLNGFANQAWDPFREHLEGLIPLADPNRPPRDAQQEQAPRHAAHNGNDIAAAPAQGIVEPNPAQTAARLVAERRNANANWLLDQVRRLERAGLLFLASIAPGVAERHIAQLEAQERAERQRREAEEAAAAAAATAAGEQAGEVREGEGVVEREGDSAQENQQDQGEAGGAVPQAVPDHRPLIEL